MGDINNDKDDKYFIQLGSGGNAGQGTTKSIWYKHRNFGGGAGGNGGGAVRIKVMGNIYMSKGSKILADGKNGSKFGCGGDGGSIDIECNGKIIMREGCLISAWGGKKGGGSNKREEQRYNSTRYDGKMGRIRIKCDSQLLLNCIRPSPIRTLREDMIDKDLEFEYDDDDERKTKRMKKLKKKRKIKAIKCGRYNIDSDYSDDDIKRKRKQRRKEKDGLI